MSQLETDLLAAHAAGDKPSLVALYSMASHQATDLDAACFYAVYAYIFALEINHPKQTELFNFLKLHGREA